MTEVLSGNTIRLYSYFYDLNNINQLIDPDEVLLIFYDEQWNKLSETILNNTNKKSVGVYFYDYVVNDDKKLKVYNYEFKGFINGKPSLNRGDLKTIPKR